MISLFNLIRPDLVFISVWFMSLLFALNFSYFGLPTLKLNSPIVLYSIFISLQYIIIFQTLKIFLKIPKSPNHNLMKIKYNKDQQRKLSNLAYLFFAFWALIFFITTIIKGGFPSISIFFGNRVILYNNFNLPTISGLSNLFRILGCSLFGIYFLREFISFRKIKINTKLIIFLFVLFSPLILTLSRGDQSCLLLVFLSTLVAFSEVKLNYKKIILFSFVFILIVIIFICLFAAFQFLRIGSNELLMETLGDLDIYIKGLRFESNIKQLDFLTKGITGLVSFSFVTYFSGPINNINLKMIEAPDFNFTFGFLNQIFPSFIRNIVTEKDYGSLLIDIFNTSTFLDNYVKSFGVIGSLPSIFLIQFFSVYFYFKAYMGSLYFRIVYPVIFTANFLAYFSDYFTILTFILYPILVLIYFKTIKKSFINLPLSYFR
tara:strand:+ start:512 stop:1807 length:1296 start_codon:yes stop_codon:yes gene_type:complete